MSKTRRAVEAGGAEIVTVAIRRINLGQNPGEPNLLEVLPPDRYTILPNTAGCYTAEDAVRTCRLARELLDDHRLVKLEVLADAKTLFPRRDRHPGWVAEQLVKEGFEVMVYTSDDPVIAKRLEQIGCVAVMPLAAPIGSGLGVQNRYNILSIIENARVPIIVDAGVGTASDAAIAMELGYDGVLMNTAIAEAKDLDPDKASATKARHHRRPRSLPRRAHAATALCLGLLAARRHHRVMIEAVRHDAAEPGAPAEGAPMPHIRSYAPRGPHSRGAQEEALERLWPRYGIDLAGAQPRSGRDLGRRAAGGGDQRFGSGDHMLASAQARPDTDFIGIEVHRPFGAPAACCNRPTSWG